jgi:hypothetical protein
MSGSANAIAALLKDPVSFMQSNLIMINFAGPSGQYSMTLVDYGWPVTLPNGQQGNGYFLSPGNGPHCFDAFWCNYVSDTTHSVTVGPGHIKLMFTANMDGCSVGVGSPTLTKHRLISHSNSMQVGILVGQNMQARGALMCHIMGRNFQTLPGNHPQVNAIVARSHQQYAQRFDIQQHHGGDPGLETIEPQDYRRDSTGKETLSSTTFGVKDDNDDWAFYVQKRGFSGKTPILAGLVFVAGDQPPARGGGCVLF